MFLDESGFLHPQRLTRFLDEPRIALDNNATELALRGMVLGRKESLRLPLEARH